MSTEKPIDYDYPRGLTFEQVWASIQKLSESIQELDKKHEAIFEREAKEREERQKAEDERRKEWETRQKVTDEGLNKLKERVDATTRSVDNLTKNMGGLSNRFGELAEHLIAPNIAERFNELGYHFDGVARGGFEISENKQVVTEIDILLENEKTIAIVEVKAKPNLHDVRQHLKRMHIARRYYERHGNTDKELIGAVAGAIFPDNIKKFTIETGFYVITQSGDTVKIDVPKGFEPRKF